MAKGRVLELEWLCVVYAQPVDFAVNGQPEGRGRSRGAADAFWPTTTGRNGHLARRTGDGPMGAHLAPRSQVGALLAPHILFGVIEAAGTLLDG